LCSCLRKTIKIHFHIKILTNKSLAKKLRQIAHPKPYGKPIEPSLNRIKASIKNISIALEKAP
jgi:hypothetical protein